MKNAYEGFVPPVDSLYIHNLKTVTPILSKAGPSDVPETFYITLCKSDNYVIFIIPNLIYYNLSTR